MKEPMDLDARVAPLRADVVSGATAVAQTAAEIVTRALEEAPDETSYDELRDRTGALVVRILDAQPAMAPLVHLGIRVLEATEDGGAVGGIEAARSFRDEVERSGSAVAEEAATVLPKEGRVLTLSRSSTVRTVLTALDPERMEVVCLESRPVREGRHLARELSREGFRVVYGVDAAVWSLTRGAAAILVGADSIGDRGAVNKIGTRALVEAGRAEDVPAVLVAGTEKLLPPGVPQELDDPRPGEEVWSAPPGIRIWNHYFEAIPLDRFDLVVTQDGARSPEELEARRRKIAVPEELQRWSSREE